MKKQDGRVIYLMGPSGAGKDSLLDWLMNHLPPELPMRLARRTITRPSTAGGEQHCGVDAAAFERLRAADRFALDWQANGLRYGVAHAELAPVEAGAWVVVNGSRAYLAQALARFPRLTPVHVTASVDTLRRRLLARGRETAQDVEARVQRAVAFQPPADAIRIDNDGTLAEAGAHLLRALAQLAGRSPLEPRLSGSPPRSGCE